MNHTVRITTGARLHFGLLDIAAPFGGCGVMIDTPSTIVEVTRSNEFAFSQSDGTTDHQTRTTTIARRIAASLRSDQPLPDVHVHLIRSAPTHAGLGSGTQLSLAISEAILRAISTNPHDAILRNNANDEASSRQREIWFDAADRGRRSAVGTHGYLHGGFIAEGIRCEDSLVPLNPLDACLKLPAAWRVSVLLPADPQSVNIETVSGEQEQARFSSLPPVSKDRRDFLSRLLTGSLIPAIKRADFEAFGHAVTRYNHASGELFADVQGGAYNGTTTTQLIDQLQASGYVGVGQSSWGPGVFVWHADEDSGNDFQSRWDDERFRVILAGPQSEGRSVLASRDQ